MHFRQKEEIVRAGVLVCALVLMPRFAGAETNQVRVADSQGLTHLPIRVAVERHLIEQHAKMLGIPDVKVSFQTVGSGVVVGQLLLSGQADLGVSGNVPMFVMSDKTSGGQKVRGIMSLARSNQLLLTVDPMIKSVADYKPDDKIAMTEPKVSTYALTLEMAAAKAFGWDQRKRLEGNAVPMSNGDAMGLMLSGASEVKSHFTVLPFSASELASPKVRLVLNSRDIVGYPYTSTAAITTERFSSTNPKLFSAIVAALRDAIDFINAHPREAAEIFLKYEKYPGGIDALVPVMLGKTRDELSFTSTPKGTSTFTDLMYNDGLLKTKPRSWKDFWFSNVWDEAGD